MKNILILFLFLSGINTDFAQTDNFKYSVSLKPISIPGLPGLHSFVVAQEKGKWLVIGGRKDGSHAKQPFKAFSREEINSEIFVIDASGNKFWKSSLNELAVNLKEQLQSGNMNFYQDNNTLYLTGGYAYSESNKDYITFPYLTSVSVSDLINAVMTGAPVSSFFRQIEDTVFAVTGGQMGKIGNTFYLVGGQKFNGMYNPMGHPTYKQTYADGIRKFSINNSGNQLSFSDLEILTDQVNLHRRDYNLLPQIFPDGSKGYTVSSGVFHANANYPFLYPVDITASFINPVTSFNQHLSNYHTAKVCLYDKKNKQMNTLFFGGISQYYFSGNELVNDRNVPYVKTISRLSRYADGSLHEFALPVEMPAFTGANGEFIIDHKLNLFSPGIIDLSKIKKDSALIGYIFGGILSSELNPFTKNNTGSSSANNIIYEVRLIRTKTMQGKEADGSNPFSANIILDEKSVTLNAELSIPYDGIVYLSVTDKSGIIVFQKTFANLKKGNQLIGLTEKDKFSADDYNFNFNFDNKFADIKKVVIYN